MKKLSLKKIINISLCLMLVFSLCACGNKEEISGQDYVEVEPIPKEDTEPSSQTDEGAKEEIIPEQTEPEITENDYFKTNNIVYSADKTFSPAVKFCFVNPEQTAIVDGGVFQVYNEKCTLSFGECSKTDNSDGTVEIKVVINGEASATFEENQESDGTSEFDYIVESMNFSLADKYSGNIILGKCSVDDEEISHEITTNINGSDMLIKATEKTQWKDASWSEWSEPTETNGYVATLNWPFEKTITISAPADYDGACLFIPTASDISFTLESYDNTDKQILDAEYFGNKYGLDNLTFVEVNSLLQ